MIRQSTDRIAAFITSKTVKLMIQKDHKIKGSRALIIGIIFKENCPDIRNTKAIDVINELMEYGCNVDVCDPWANKEEVQKEYGISIKNELPKKQYDTIVLAVAHKEFIKLDLTPLRSGDNTVIFDIKGIWDIEKVDGRL